MIIALLVLILLAILFPGFVRGLFGTVFFVLVAAHFYAKFFG